MNKTEFLKNFCEEDKAVISNIYDKMKLADEISRNIYTNEFYTPNIWKKLLKIKNPFEITIQSDGIFKSSERRMLRFSKDFPENDEFPYELLKIQNLSKFENLTHRDYLGAIMSLGIIRNKLGDLVLGDNCCYAAVCRENALYVSQNIEKIKRCKCQVSIADRYEQLIPDVKFEEFSIISTSLRLDCLVSSICKLSRSKAADLINDSSVSVDYAAAKAKDYTVSAEETITIRGYGKYKLEKITGTTGRERMKLLMKKFV